MTTTAEAPTTTLDTCAGCGAVITPLDLNYAATCSDDPDALYGDCCYTAHRDANECGCLADEIANPDGI